MSLSPLNNNSGHRSNLPTPVTPDAVTDSVSLCLEQQHPLVSSCASENNYATIPSQAVNIVPPSGEYYMVFSIISSYAIQSSNY